MKIVMVAPGFPLKEKCINGGTQAASVYLCEALQKLSNIDLVIIRPFSQKEESGVLSLYGNKVIAINSLNRLSDAFDYKDRNATLKLISEINPDIVHFQTLPTWSLICHYKNVVTVHGIAERDVLFKNSYIESRLKFIILWLRDGIARKRIKNVIAINPYVYKFLGDPKKQFRWDIPNPVSKDFFHLRRKPIPGRIFSASHMTPLKNTHSLISAFSNIARSYPYAELRVAGSHQESEYGKFCKTLVKNLKLEGKVNFLGLLTREKLKEELSLSSCFALCSLQENSPIAIAEAMSTGIPVIAPKIGGLPWMIDDGIDGLLVDPNSINEIAIKLDRIIGFPNSQNLGDKARIKSKIMYDAETIAQKTRNVYEEIIKRETSN